MKRIVVDFEAPNSATFDDIKFKTFEFILSKIRVMPAGTDPVDAAYCVCDALLRALLGRALTVTEADDIGALFRDCGIPFRVEDNGRPELPV